MNKIATTFILFLLCSFCVSAQQDQPKKNKGTFSGNLQTQASLFLEDTLIGATNFPQYDSTQISTENWLRLNYSNWGFDFGLRLDAFSRSNLINPNGGSYSDAGIGYWHIHTAQGKFDITLGHIYDVIGTGIIFRSYQERGLFIDNALIGARLEYKLNNDWSIRGYVGKNKFLFGTKAPLVKGGAIEGYIAGKEGSKFSMSPGFGVINRTFDDGTMEELVAVLKNYLDVDRFQPEWEVLAFSLYNTVNFGKFNWYTEAAYKTNDVIFDMNATRTLFTGEQSAGKYILTPGSVIYSTLSYANKGLGISLEGKRTENFIFRSTPFDRFNEGFLNFIPPMNRQSSYRLVARYLPATQELGELAFQADVRYRLNKKWSFLVNMSTISTLNNQRLYQELYTAVTYKKRGKYTLTAGLQFLEYDQGIYQEAGLPIVNTITPYLEFLYKFDRKTSIRTEWQYLDTDEDFGSWLFALVEVGFAPQWLITVADMYNIDPSIDSPGPTDKKVHYPTVAVAYNYKTHRFSLSYVKQVEGVVCTGGVCRLEPAFSGVRFTLNSTF
jgi:hypothetical protein